MHIQIQIQTIVLYQSKQHTTFKISIRTASRKRSNNNAVPTSFFNNQNKNNGSKHKSNNHDFKGLGYNTMCSVLFYSLQLNQLHRTEQEDEPNCLNKKKIQTNHNNTSLNQCQPVVCSVNRHDSKQHRRSPTFSFVSPHRCFRRPRFSRAQPNAKRIWNEEINNTDQQIPLIHSAPKMEATSWSSNRIKLWRQPIRNKHMKYSHNNASQIIICKKQHLHKHSIVQLKLNNLSLPYLPTKYYY